MKLDQRIKELREMFLQLSEIVVQEVREGRSDQVSDTVFVMKKIQSELEWLEEKRKQGLN